MKRFICILVLALVSCVHAQVNWTDKRPIMDIFLGGGAYVGNTNPQGWYPNLVNPNGTTNPNAVNAYFNSLVTTMQTKGYQGSFFHDMEGYHFLSCTYIGDPRVRLDPVMGTCVDNFIAKCTSLGLRTGCCLRPTTLVTTVAGTTIQVETTPGSVAEVTNKMIWAQKRWGKLFSIAYVDSNASAVYYQRGFIIPGQEASNFVTGCPGVLSIWEGWTPDLQGWGMTYVDLRTGGAPLLMAGNPAVCCIAQATVTPAQQPQVDAAVKSGAILLIQP